jgi:hypothetical protein
MGVTGGAARASDVDADTPNNVVPSFFPGGPLNTDTSPPNIRVATAIPGTPNITATIALHVTVPATTAIPSPSSTQPTPPSIAHRHQHAITSGIRVNATTAITP